MSSQNPLPHPPLRFVLNLMERSFDEIYESYGVSIHAFLARLTGNAWTADELCQETFVKYLAHEKALVGRNGSLGPWLFRVATNLGIDRMRRRRSHALGIEPEARVAPSNSSIDQSDVQERVRAELMELAPELRATFLLRAHHGLTYRQIGEALGVSERASKDRYRRVRERLMGRLAHLLEENER